MVTLSVSQVKVLSIEELSVPTIEQWNSPVFSPDGKKIFLTNSDYNGIWEYSLDSKLLREITRDKHSGYDFSISDDGTRLAYRYTSMEGEPGEREQRTVEIGLKSGNRFVWNSGNSVWVPRYSGNEIIDPGHFPPRGPRNPAQLTRPPIVFGVEQGKIVLMNKWTQRSIEPLNNGRYIWPSLSPDKTKIVAVDMERGAFVCGIDGSNVSFLGKCNAPRWTRSGNWIIGMDDVDDGHEITGSELIAVSADGKSRIRLTSTPSHHEMFPAVSPVDNTVISSTADGKLFLLRYTEGE